MKRSDLMNKISKLGYTFLRHGGNHDVYSNGKRTEIIPRHKEINEVLAKAIIKRCGGV